MVVAAENPAGTPFRHFFIRVHPWLKQSLTHGFIFCGAPKKKTKALRQSSDVNTGQGGVASGQGGLSYWRVIECFG
jgi:hypothetical protein